MWTICPEFLYKGNIRSTFRHVYHTLANLVSDRRGKRPSLLVPFACRYLTSCPHSCATFTKQVPPRGGLTVLGTMYVLYTAPGSCCACAPLRACFSLQHFPCRAFAPHSLRAYRSDTPYLALSSVRHHYHPSVRRHVETSRSSTSCEVVSQRGCSWIRTALRYHARVYPEGDIAT